MLFVGFYCTLAVPNLINLLIMIIANTISDQEYNLIWVLISFFLSGIISYLSYPIIIKISKMKHLMQSPGVRSSHIVKTPNLGGVGIFLGVITVTTLIGGILGFNNLLCFIGANIILFFTGLKDDLIELSAINKLIGQIIAALAVIIITDIRIHSFFGLFGMEILPYAFSVLFTLFVFIILINAFNLIDGVDGLAASVAAISSILFSVFFYKTGNFTLLMISLSLVGALLTFLFFNFSKTKKMFMGDTGSMIIGFLMAYQAISFLEINRTNSIIESTSSINAPLLVLAIFSYPLMDTLRVFIIRIKNKKSPFSADKNHLHHNLLSLGFKHWQISLIASVYVLLIFGIAYNYKHLDLHISLFALILLSICASYTPYLILKMKDYVKDLNRTDTYANSKPKYNYYFKQMVTQILNIFL